MNGIGAAVRKWRVNQHEKKSTIRQRCQNSVALGFAWSAANVGGVRRHLECIEKHSSFPVSIYPSHYASMVLKNGAERNSYHAGLGEKLIGRHALFHSHVDPQFISLARRAQKQGKPWVHTYHLLYFAEDWGNKLEPWQLQINESLLKVARQSDLCLAVGSWLVDWLSLNHGIECSFLPNGADIGACDQADPNRFREKHRVEEFALFVNSVAEVKNPLAFIEAARLLPQRTFVMIGTGLTQAGIAAKLGIEVPENVRALGPLPHALTLDAISACSVFVMTSHREGLPTVLLEAMAMRKPCVVPDAPWFSDAIPSRLFGLRYRVGFLQDLASEIETAFGLGSIMAARERVEEKFAWPVVAAQLDKIYSRLLT